MKINFTKHTTNRTKLGRIALTLFALTGIGIIGLNPGSARSDETNPIAQQTPAPELVGKKWVNTPNNAPIKLADRKGKVTLVHFWTLGCINCKHNLPAYNHLQKKFTDQGVAIIGVHTPETPGESRFANVQSSIRKWGITYPVLVDNDNTNWNRWHQHYWPTLYLLDRTGKIRYRWEGELEYDHQNGERIITEKINELLKEK